MKQRVVNTVLIAVLALNLYVGTRNYLNSAETTGRQDVYSQMEKFTRVLEEVRRHYVDQEKVDVLNKGESYIKHIPASKVQAQLDAGQFEATTDCARVGELGAVLICVPTPLDADREPDLSYVLNTGRAIAPHLNKGMVVVLESTTYPGTTEDELRPILERGSGLVAGTDFHLAYSPEREDPGNPESRL